MNALLFSVLGGALLTRYLLPMYPLVLLVAVSTFYRRVPFWQGLAVFSAAAFVAGLFINPPYGFAPEDNLDYARVVRMHLAGIAQLNKRFPGSTVLSAWPVTDELTKPELGYVKAPFEVDRLRISPRSRSTRQPRSRGSIRRRWCFRPSTIRRAAAEPWAEERRAGSSGTSGCITICRRRLIAQRLDGALVWQREDHGMWIALIRFNRQFEAVGASRPSGSAIARRAPWATQGCDQPIISLSCISFLHS